uniref:Uncharacterized protein n=1 Tax=Quercus lobata TaxID=97700 RepID=A0A7N2MWM5_QUELO
MDFSPLTVTEALASKSYEKIAHICDHLLLQAAAEGVAYEDNWPYYSIHLLAHIYVDDIEAFAFIISWFCLLGHCR